MCDPACRAGEKAWRRFTASARIRTSTPSLENMSKLTLSVAMGDYDRTRALQDGSVRIDGVDPVFMMLSPEEAFFRAFRGGEFDVSELSLSSYALKLAQGDCPYVAVPVFLSRAFRHTAIYVRRDRVRTPADLRGKRVGIPEYQLTERVGAGAA